MADLQCVICDYVPPQPDEQTANEVLSIMGGAAMVTEDRAELLIAHMESHTLVDWVRAFKMADVYIAGLESQLAEAKSALTEMRAAPVIPRLPMSEPQQYFEQYPDSVVSVPTTPNGTPMLTPSELASYQRRKEAERIVREKGPDESLIPFYRADQRPEGAVGRKF